MAVPSVLRTNLPGHFGIEKAPLKIFLARAFIRIDVPLHNNAFVDLHVQGVGPVKGRVLRAYEGDTAVSFHIEDSEKAKLANSLEVFHKNNRRGY